MQDDAGNAAAIATSPAPMVRRITPWIWVASILVLDFGIGRIFLTEWYGDTVGQLRLFNLDGELTLASWWSSTLMWSSAIVLGLIAILTRRTGRGGVALLWALAVVFVYLSLDETAQTHEYADRLLPGNPQFTGALRFAWVIVAAPLLVVGGLIFLSLLTKLPRRTATGIVLAAFIYVGGAFGMEFSGAYFSDDRHSLGYHLSVVAEEGLELVGLSLFLTVLLHHLAALGQEASRPGAERA